jgi:hypothetical protein
MENKDTISQVYVKNFFNHRFNVNQTRGEIESGLTAVIAKTFNISAQDIWRVEMSQTAEYPNRYHAIPHSFAFFTGSRTAQTIKDQHPDEVTVFDETQLIERRGEDWGEQRRDEKAPDTPRPD